MGNALRMGLAGGLMGGMGAMQQQYEQTQYELRSERALRAKAAMDQRIAQIQAENASAKDARDHSQALELEGAKSKSAGEREAARQAANDRRAAETRAASDKRAETSASARVRAAEISASRPRSEGSKPKAQLFANEDGEQQWIEPGEDIPEGFFRAPTSGRPKVEAPKPAPMPAKVDPDAPPMAGARKAPDGLWYVQQGGKWFKVN